MSYFAITEIFYKLNTKYSSYFCILGKWYEFDNWDQNLYLVEEDIAERLTLELKKAKQVNFESDKDA